MLLGIIGSPITSFSAMAKNIMNSSAIVSKDNVGAILDHAMDAGQGLLRLTPTWVPRSFLHPGKRLTVLIVVESTNDGLPVLPRPQMKNVFRMKVSATSRLKDNVLRCATPWKNRVAN